MKHSKRHKFAKYKVLFFITLLCISFVSCSSFNSNKIERLLYQANLMANDNDSSNALDQYNLILELDNTNQKALYNKALILFNMNDNQRALNTINKLIIIDPLNIKAYQLKIQILSSNNNPKTVIDEYNDIISKFPTLTSIRVDFINYLISNYDQNNELIKNNLTINAKFLLNQNLNIALSAKALCLVDKNNIEYSTLLYTSDKKTWEEIYSPSN